MIVTLPDPVAVTQLHGRQAPRMNFPIDICGANSKALGDFRCCKQVMLVHAIKVSANLEGCHPLAGYQVSSGVQKIGYVMVHLQAE